MDLICGQRGSPATLECRFVRASAVNPRGRVFHEERWLPEWCGIEHRLIPTLPSLSFTESLLFKKNIHS